jgi:CRP-like cAMP-binding protein
MEPEKMFITDFESFINECPSKYYLQFYQDTETWMISRKNLLFLYERYKDWAFFGLKLMENYHVRILELFTIMFQNNASENYHFIETNFSDFLKTAPLKDVASMLNLSPVSLSRIRAGKQTKR